MCYLFLLSITPTPQDHNFHIKWIIDISSFDPTPAFPVESFSSVVLLIDSIFLSNAPYLELHSLYFIPSQSPFHKSTIPQIRIPILNRITYLRQPCKWYKSSAVILSRSTHQYLHFVNEFGVWRIRNSLADFFLVNYRFGPAFFLEARLQKEKRKEQERESSLSL